MAYYCFDCDIAKLKNIQTDAIRLITGATLRSSICKLYREVTLPTIQTCIDNASVNMMSKILNNQAPPYLCDLVVKEDLDRPYNFRHRSDPSIPLCRLEIFQVFFFYMNYKSFGFTPNPNTDI